VQHARPHLRAASVENAENAGIKQLKMYHMVNTKQKEILKKIRTLPLRKYGSAKHKKLIKEYIKYDPYFPPSKIS
jgi:hypothetical protein